MSKRFYVAYGSNLNIRQMKYRCPTAKLYGIGIIEDYELQFKGQPNGAFATIAPREGATVPVAVWEIKSKDELSLDHYEGYPSHYFKQHISVRLDSEEVSAMVYIMNLKMGFGLPAPYYYQTVLEGYHDCKLNTDVLNQAVGDSAQRYYSEIQQNQQTLLDAFDFEENDGEFDEWEEDDGEEVNGEESKTTPFHFPDEVSM